MLELRIIDNDVDYLDAIFLREEILRKPLGLRYSQEEIISEKSHINFGAYKEGQLLATATLVPKENSCKMQRVAVREGFQDQGIGGQLIKFIENEAIRLGFDNIYCHARDTAVPFYKKHGYVILGQPFYEVGIGHVMMRKLLGFIEQKSSAEDEILPKIVEFNKKNGPCKNVKIDLNYSIKEDGKMIAGIESCVYFDNILHIAFLFVEEKYRKKDLGSYLLAKVEQEAKGLGAKLAHLDTFDFQASKFYPKYGYEAFGILECPAGLKRFYFKKEL